MFRSVAVVTSFKLCLKKLKSKSQIHLWSQGFWSPKAMILNLMYEWADCSID